MNNMTNTLLSTTLAISALAGMVPLAHAHGYVSSPMSRSLLCNKGSNLNCGAIQYEPQSVEGPKGFPQTGPLDGVLASGGQSRSHELDQQSATRWSNVTLHPGSNIFTWTITAKHKTTDWQYFITKQGWDPTKPLSRASFDLMPFCKVSGNDAVPASPTSHTCSIPADRTGHNVILATWNIADTGNAFYQAIDANIVK